MWNSSAESSVSRLVVTALLLLPASCDRTPPRIERQPETLCVVRDDDGGVTASFAFGCVTSSLDDLRDGSCTIEGAGHDLAVVLTRPSHRRGAGVSTDDCDGIAPVTCSSGPPGPQHNRMTFEGTELFRLDTQGASDNPFCVALVPGAEASARVRRVQSRVEEARAALERGSFVACANAAQMALTGDTTARAQLDARWLIAQCSLLAHDAVSAGDSLREFKDNANIKDPRMPLVRAQLTALERGALPDGVRTAPASQAEATALAARLDVASDGKEARRAESLTISVSLGRPVVLGPRDARTIDRVLQKKLNELIGCLPPGAMTADERRRIVMKWVIDAKGKVPQAKVDELDGLNTATATCLMARVRSWRFPPDGRDAGITIVTQPFVFQSVETRSDKEP